MNGRRRTAQRGDWEAHPLTIPEAIPPPARLWTESEIDRIRLGYIPSIMEEKWFIFMEEDRLFAHRSWTGLGVYEAAFAPAGGDEDESELLASCYRESLVRADEVGAGTVAFPAISTGVYGYPIEAAAAIAVETVHSTPTDVDEVIFVAFNQETFDAYAEFG